MLNGGEKGSRSGLVWEKQKYSFGFIINLMFQLIWVIMIYGFHKFGKNKLFWQEKQECLPFVIGIIGLVMVNSF